MSRPLWKLLIESANSDSINLTCDECIIIVEYLADVGATGVDAELLMEVTQRHLTSCQRCYGHFVRYLDKLELSTKE